MQPQTDLALAVLRRRLAFSRRHIDLQRTASALCRGIDAPVLG